MRAVVVDIETGGLDKAKHPIIQIAAIGVDLDLLIPIQQFEAKVMFLKENAEAQALSLNSYNEETWARDAKHPVAVAEQLSDFFKSFADITRKSAKSGREYKVACGVAYNSEFDIPFIHEWFKRLNTFCPLDWGSLCVMQRAKWFAIENPVLGEPENFKLTSVCQWLGIDLPDAHDAMADCRAALDVYRRIRNG